LITDRQGHAADRVGDARRTTALFVPATLGGGDVRGQAALPQRNGAGVSIGAASQATIIAMMLERLKARRFAYY
jgi:hypothetical protein